jgi:hypothetical protein
MRRVRLFAGTVLAMMFVACAAVAHAGILISVDKSTQRMSVSVDGEQRHVWPVSTGRAGYATPAGNFQPFRMEEDHYSKEWDDAPMPHSIFFTKIGHAIHGSLETKRLGTPASHGCVRLAPENAAKLFALVKQAGVMNTKVVISGAEPPPAVARRNPAREAGREAVREPVPIGGESVGRRARASDDDLRAWGEPQQRELDAYAARMRQRYYYEQMPPAYEERAPAREVYQAPPTYYYQRGDYSYGSRY